MKNWKKLLIKKKTKIKKLLQKFEKNNEQIGIVIEDGILEGTVTDGDIRRGLLNNLNLENEVEKIMNKNPVTINKKLSNEEINITLSKYSIKYIPLVDSNNRVTNVFSYRDFQENKQISNPVIIMAGGEGRRLRPLTKKTPKPMVDINGVPIIEKSIKELISYGFKTFYISINYLGNIIKDHFGNGEKFGVNINYIEEKLL